MVRQRTALPETEADPRHRVEGSGTVVPIASSPEQESRQPWSLPRSRANWQASSGRSPNKHNLPAPDAEVAPAIAKGGPHPQAHPKLGKAGGMVTARRTLVSTTS